MTDTTTDTTTTMVNLIYRKQRLAAYIRESGVFEDRVPFKIIGIPDDRARKYCRQVVNIYAYSTRREGDDIVCEPEPSVIVTKYKPRVLGPPETAQLQALLFSLQETLNVVKKTLEVYGVSYDGI